MYIPRWNTCTIVHLQPTGEKWIFMLSLFITSQRGSAWQCSILHGYIGRWLSMGKLLLSIFIFYFPFPCLAYRSQFCTDLHVLWLKRRVMFCIRAFSGCGAFKLTFNGSLDQTSTFRVFDPFLGSGNRFSIIALENKLLLKVKGIPQKLDFWLEVTNQEVLSHTCGLTANVFFKNFFFLNFEKLLPVLYYIKQILTKFGGNWKCCEFDIERICWVEK